MRASRCIVFALLAMMSVAAVSVAGQESSSMPRFQSVRVVSETELEQFQPEGESASALSPHHALSEADNMRAVAWQMKEAARAAEATPTPTPEPAVAAEPEPQPTLPMPAEATAPEPTVAAALEAQQMAAAAADIDAVIGRVVEAVAAKAEETAVAAAAPAPAPAQAESEAAAAAPTEEPAVAAAAAAPTDATTEAPAADGGADAEPVVSSARPAGLPLSGVRLPAGWQAYRSPSGVPYYWNTVTSEPTWEMPTRAATEQTEPRVLSSMSAEMSSSPGFSASASASITDENGSVSMNMNHPDSASGVPPSGWVAIFDSASGNYYFWNSLTQERTWIMPSKAANEPSVRAMGSEQEAQPEAQQEQQQQQEQAQQEQQAPAAEPQTQAEQPAVNASPAASSVSAPPAGPDGANTAIALTQDEDALRAEFSQLSKEVAALEDASQGLHSKRKRLIALARNIVVVTGAKRDQQRQLQLQQLEQQQMRAAQAQAEAQAQAMSASAPASARSLVQLSNMPVQSEPCLATPERLSVLAQMNQLRREFGGTPGFRMAAPLHLSSSLTRAAQQHVNQMIRDQKLTHYGDLRQLVSGWNNLGENIAFSFTGVQHTGTNWFYERNNHLPKDHPKYFAHRDNIMNAKYAYVGIHMAKGPAPQHAINTAGQAAGGDVWYIAAVFSNKATLPGPALHTKCTNLHN